MPLRQAECFSTAHWIDVCIYQQGFDSRGGQVQTTGKCIAQGLALLAKTSLDELEEYVEVIRRDEWVR